MKYSLALLALLVAVSLGEEPLPLYIETLQDLHRRPPLIATKTGANVETRWIPQWLDNNNPDRATIWHNRIMINDDYFESGSPIFIVIGGEYTIEETLITSGIIVDIANQHRGSLVLIEHRFYGQSRPTVHLTKENLKYLSVQQALADIRNIIRYLKTQEKYKSSKVVMTGCSYPGTMTVFYKKLYPNDIVGGWASSAPLEAKLDFKEFFEVIGDDYREASKLAPGCYDLIKNSFSYYEDLFRNGDSHRAKKELNICEDVDVDNERNRWLIFRTMANALADEVLSLNPSQLTNFCKQLTLFDNKMALRRFMESYIKQKNQTCFYANYQGVVESYKLYMYNNNENGLPWLYQTCSEFGWFQSPDSDNQPFGSYSPVTLDIYLCNDVFGFTLEQIKANIQQTNNEFGGKNPNVTNVYMTYGSGDPWHKLGAGPEQGANIIPSEGHCTDLDSIRREDSTQLLDSKQRLITLVARWLA